MRSIIILALICTACTGQRGGHQYQTEIALHKVRADIEEIKHDLHTHQMELSVLEGKTQSSEDALLSIRKEGIELEHGKMEKYQTQLVQLGQKVLQVERKQAEIEKHLESLLAHSTEVQKALSQYKDKINEVERNLSLHHQTLSDIAKVKDHLKTLSDLALSQTQIDMDGRLVQPYRVKAGDTLEKIAKEHKSSVEVLRKINHMNNDLILAGQDLFVPKKTD